MMSDERDIETVRLAVMAAGAADQGWATRVARLVPRVAAVFREPNDDNDPVALVNIARKVAEAHPFKAEYRGHEYDENTQRIFVKLFDEKSQDGDYLDDNGYQTVRTEPMWSPYGRTQRDALDRLEVGQPILAYRYTEQIDKKRKMGLLIHFEVLGRRRMEGQAPPPARSQRRPDGAQTPPSEPPEQVPPPAPAASPSATPPADDDAALVELGRRFEALSSRQRVAYGRGCQGFGISDPMSPASEQMAKAFELMAKVES